MKPMFVSCLAASNRFANMHGIAQSVKRHGLSHYKCFLLAALVLIKLLQL